jgi:hypothetical protein
MSAVGSGRLRRCQSPCKGRTPRRRGIGGRVCGRIESDRAVFNTRLLDAELEIGVTDVWTTPDLPRGKPGHPPRLFQSLVVILIRL